MPQFDPTVMLPQIIWLVIVFGIFYFLMSRIILPRIGDVLEDREERIADDLDQAQQVSKEAENVENSLESGLTDARAESLNVTTQARAEAQAQLDARAKELDATLSAQAEQAEANIQAEKAKALAEVENVAADACKDIVAKLIGDGKIDEAAVQAAVKAQISARGNA